MAWFGWGFLLTIWGRDRQETPDPATGHVIPFENHGLIYVTVGDLWISRALLAATAMFLLACLILELLEKRKRE